MSRRKMILTAIVLTLVLLIGGILAYFTDYDETDATITVGNVKIKIMPESTLTFAENMEPLDKIDFEDEENEDKQITIMNIGNNPAYVFAEIDVPTFKGSELPLETVGNVQDEHDDDDNIELYNVTFNDVWRVLSKSVANGKTTYILAYVNSEDEDKMEAIPATGSEVQRSTSAIIQTVELANIREDATKVLKDKDLSIKIKAYAIQTRNIGGSDVNHIKPDVVWNILMAESSVSNDSAINGIYTQKGNVIAGE